MEKDIEEFLKAGNDILNSVSSAIDRNDYSTLHDDVARAVKSVSVQKKTIYSSEQKNAAKPSYGYTRTTPKQTYIPFLQKRISKYLGIPQVVVASIVGILDAMTFVGTLFGGVWPGAILTGVILATSIYFIKDGMNKYHLAQNYYKYGNILKDAEYFNIKDLAKASLSQDKEVLKNIKAMIKKGFLPRAQLDSTETVCMITDRAYEQYLGAEKDRAEREAREDEKKRAQESAAKAEEEEYKNLPAGAVAVLKEGKEYIAFVREVNDEIPDTEEFSNKLYRLEETMNKIFTQVKKDPSSADELRKLMNYYLPTTKKLLNAYVDLYKHSNAGNNVTQTRAEIEAAIDVINEAFEKLLDSLFQDMAWDISSDISVMKTMMAQDGLN